MFRDTVVHHRNRHFRRYVMCHRYGAIEIRIYSGRFPNILSICCSFLDSKSAFYILIDSLTTNSSRSSSERSNLYDRSSRFSRTAIHTCVRSGFVDLLDDSVVVCRGVVTVSPSKNSVRGVSSVTRVVVVNSLASFS
ncbi:hypothetical protein PUN28_013614 [Cardiocondyla obscurior]|uniref:Uncharacterized protein n=1 Tax=Cardiocondyla obscurior TaxID=286306 RepID=A0AAW2F4E1_9HYME